jgi:hypothetical protein
MHKEPPLLGLGASIGDLEELTTEVSSSFTDSFSFILMSVTPMENAEITSLLEICGILFLIWLKHWMY